MLVCVLWAWTVFLASVSASCDFPALSRLSQNLRYDESALSEYSQLAAQLALCGTRDAEQLRCQLLYKSGLIQVSSGNDLAALEHFEAILNAPDSSTFKPLAQKRLREIYQKYGYWHKLSDSGIAKHYETLKKSFAAHLKRNEPVPLPLREEFQNLAPLALDTLVLLNDALYYDLSRSLGINTAQSIIENYKTLLGKHKKLVSVTDKLKIHHAIAVLQMFVMSTPPTSLMNCLALDMEYKPCRELSKLSSRINKVNPPFTAMTHPDQFLSLHEFDWSKVLDFYTGGARLVKFADIKKGSNNLEIVQIVEKTLLDDMLLNRPLSSISEQWKLATTATSVFSVTRDLILCEAYDQMSKPKIAEKFCQKVEKEKLTPEVLEALHAFSDSLQNIESAKETLHKVWQDFPSLALHAVRKCLNTLSIKEKARNGMDTTQIWALLETFTHEHEWKGSQNEAISKANRVIKNTSGKKRREHQERFQQQQQHQQQQFFRHQQNAPPPPNDLSKKNLYKTLGLSKDSSSKDIRKAYLTMTRKHHPDKQGQLSDEEKRKNEEKMSRINEAYEILSDEEKRRDYDNQRSNTGQQRQQSPFGNGNSGGFPFGGDRFKMNFGHFR
ncbi:LAME_0H03972g1_1 [Lachancea meyersii CBS 8951]|uniref:LAME_0H03972g1_1 n=1 Tax=Lachancea meyersii CBS 8951 TaxID=1266667 RepID=A0A1G4KDW0_9SACH|nr:LAME_0H03972g1_1 [Lachancea meyersii CBS 8951]